MAKKRESELESSSNQSANKDSGFCFTIMPFGGWHDEYYEKVFRPAIEAAKMKPRRADDVFRPGTIVQDIWSYTKEADIILADLSGKNANVLYELGLAHAIAKPAILVTESLDDIPFDLRALRVIEFNKNSPNWGEILKEKITLAIHEIIKNPLKSIPAAFLSVDETKESTKVTPEELEILEIKQELNLLKREVRSRRKSISPGIGPEEVKARVMNMMDDGFPLEEIVHNLTARGAPRSFVEYTIKDYSGSDN